MRTDKQRVLDDAPNALNRDDLPWQITVEGDSIVGTWKWMDGRFFAPGSVTDAARQYVFTVTLQDNGKWRELDRTVDQSSGFRAGPGGLGYSSRHSSFKGKVVQKSFSFGVGKDNTTGDTGLIESRLDTTQLKEWVRGYLTQCGWKKAGFFSR